MNWYHLKKQAQQNICGQPIELTTQEQSIFGMLIGAKNRMPELANVEMRVAGGWVRDKLLGKESDDIDIALSNITGADFVQALQIYGKSQGITQTGRTYIVEQNIEKSKHLATAGIDLFGQKVEFVNLRSEEYGDSRVPTMKMGTPEQDAERRDLTINALFYNIENGKVEDFVGGCQDLETMTLRTPMDPTRTFQDDPLRMLRVLRFFSRYPEAQIDPSVIEAMSQPEVQADYKKLASERAAPEIFKMMKGAKPAEAMRIMFQTGLYKNVFDLPEDFSDVQEDQQNLHHQYSLMNHLLAVLENANGLAQDNGMDDDKRAMLNLSAVFHDFGKMSPEIRTPHPKQPGYYQYLGHENVSGELAERILTQMGFSPEIKNYVATLSRSHMKAHDEGLFSDNTKSKKRLGKFLKQVGDYADDIMFLGQADALSKGNLPEEERQDITQTRQDQLTRMQTYREQQGELTTKTVIDGNAIRQIFLSVVPELVQNNAFLNINGYSGPVHHLKLTIDKLFEQQWMGRIKTPQEAEHFVTGLGKQWLGLWREQQGDTNTAKILFDLTKKSDKQ